MDTMLEKGDHKVSSLGLPVRLEGHEEVVQRAMIRLGTRKGSFPYDQQLGSQLFRLQGGSETLDQMALSYAQEALRPIPEIRVLEAGCRFLSGDELAVKVALEIEGKVKFLEVKSNRVL